MAVKNKILQSLGLVSKRDHQKELKNMFSRAFAAAKISRLQSGWTTMRDEVNREIKADNPALRARAYDMLFNNPFVAAMDYEDRYFVVGPEGFDLQPMAKFPSGVMDDFANKLIKKQFERWSRKEYCSVSQRYSFIMMQYLMRSMLRVDGEVILRKFTKGAAIKNNPFGFTLDFIDPNDIDHNYNLKVDENTFIIMGVQIDGFRRIQGIYLKKKSIYDEITTGYYAGMERECIPADELIFGFDPKHFKQVHGITPLATVMLALKDIDMWKHYSLQNAKAGAAKTGWLTKSVDAMGEYTGAVDEDGVEEEADDIGGKYMDMEPASAEELPPGWDFKGFDPKFPHEQHDPFVRSVLREAAFGVGKDYSVLSGDRAGESYSSGRTGELKMVGSYAYDQTITRELFLIPIYEAWIETALRAGALAPLMYASLEKYLEHYWQGYKKGWVDPLKKVMSDKLEEEMGYKSKLQNITERGNRMEEVFADKVLYDKMKTQYNTDIEQKENTKVEYIDKPDEENDDEDKNKKVENRNNIIRIA